MKRKGRRPCGESRPPGSGARPDQWDNCAVISTVNDVLTGVFRYGKYFSALEKKLLVGVSRWPA